MSKIDELLKNEKVEWKKLGEVCEFQRGNTITKKDIIEGVIPVIAGGQKPAYYHGISNREGVTIAVAGSGAYAGFVSYWEEPIFLSDAFSIEPNKNLNKRYLYHWLLSNQHKIFELKQGSGIPHVYGKDLGRFEIPIPSLETQEKIVETLDKFTNYVTELQAELQARNKQYEYYRDMLLSEEYLNKISMKMDALTNKDYELKMTTLGEIAQINRGASPRPIKKYITEDIKGIPWIKIGDVGVNSKYVTKTAQKITLEGAKKSRILKKGDFIMSNSMSYGRPYILGIDGAIHDGWASISGFYNTLDSDFLYYYLTSSKVQNYWKGKINSSSVDNLNSEIICSLPIPVIDKELQQVVAKVLDKFQSLLDDTEGLLPEEIEKRQKQYEYYREKLLTFDKMCDSIPHSAFRIPQFNS
ncbi:restriction endonuclease subunit S [Peptoniphilus lacrimalis]|uniref:Type I restriction modification DNA specificity domain protein n=1 Tax=Peptoniphilus lacrimalis 315-B TaxID=596330 RepID=D1VV15_9FIRM|nr:restriction endonuclease subunit S [Peptoniphilus lacrimalis]EFA89599.1 type I restriction modification DNA specificity domain protein [Peptoniphilus lacrimalis 315-B]